ncbi:MAG: hypothetical protein KGI41_03480 [Patescibacteria group bacterium]|nr:hypothetical protein [Patescibacteria group bacterium]MDE1966272.1 hypothetical protein [Patescibacteria group bacterium]
MRTPDRDRERSEKKRTRADFLKQYNESLPSSFPRATPALLAEFRKAHAGLFPRGNEWTLDVHRKKLMDWLSSHAAAVAVE